MIDKLIHFSIEQKRIILLLMVALIAVGIKSVTELPIDAVPDITNNQVQVITTAPTLGAEEMERLVTAPLEYALATLPDKVELRSISRFGLSVITVVFEDHVDINISRQMVAERIKVAEKDINGVATPEMMPVTTGLGEIYQYVLYAKPPYDKQYSAMELRTMQDWIVRRQLLGTEGVADVSTLGGFAKQYEISFQPERLRAMGISLDELFKAVQSNNENAGGAYIDKAVNRYFIRGVGMATSIADLENTVVSVRGSLPILVKDVAKVQLGYAPRFGAMTRNTDGERVGGIVLMLKGANSAATIANVKERIAQIQRTLPKGVVIEPFLDRTKLVNAAIGTVAKNLIEGALIVIFVLVLLLGNLRAGLLVASVIPLAMLFAITLMNVFGISGNLMSLGAIDFGIIVDGTVIIIEAILHRIEARHHGASPENSHSESPNRLVYSAAVQIRSSAAFGEIIILIVYLPILALVGIEGKMFGPMAQTVGLAVLGAFILSLTYVPAMAAMVLDFRHKAKPERLEVLAQAIIGFAKRLYAPVIHFALRRKYWVVGSAVAMFVLALGVFMQLGGEFIPRLDEGDFALEVRLPSGVSLAQSVETTSKINAILLDRFPEVKECVCKIGSSEIPTDPMPVEACDLTVVLKDKSEWTSAETKDELAEEMAEALEAIPGVEIGFMQPIEMRFNELMTGAKQDVAIRIFGDDLDELAASAARVEHLITPVAGVKDVYVEAVTGLPQIQVIYHREKLAQYGLNVADVNRLLRIGFAGEAAGLVFEGEKRFDVVLRMDSSVRQSIDNIRQLYLPTPTGAMISIEQVADIQYKTAPAQISHEDARRRITVAFNARGRDVESIVSEITEKMNKQSGLLPVGYTYTIGGQFRNLIQAKARLSVAVPVALLLIFILLFFTFESFKYASLIFTAIPLSAIGGVLALWLRDMPFSISAGVGFIALFGVAVLNGIVLVGEFNRLKETGHYHLHGRILRGVYVRLRPVLMTAAVASMGFLPMALSHGSGAEVQKPLATVVIGGLISATLLTLVVLPVLYALFEEGARSKVQGARRK